MNDNRATDLTQFERIGWRTRRPTELCQRRQFERCGCVDTRALHRADIKSLGRDGPIGEFQLLWLSLCEDLAVQGIAMGIEQEEPIDHVIGDVFDLKVSCVRCAGILYARKSQNESTQPEVCERQTQPQCNGRSRPGLQRLCDGDAANV